MEEEKEKSEEQEDEENHNSASAFSYSQSAGGLRALRIDEEWLENQPAFEKAATVAPMSDDLIDSKIAAAEARTETKLAVLEAKTEARHVETGHKLDGILAKIQQQGAELSKSIDIQRAEASANRTAVITTVMGVGIALFGLIVALVTYGDALFGRGMEVNDKLDAAAKHAVERQMSKTDRAQ